MARRKKNKNLKGIPAAIMLILALIGGFAERGNLMERMSGEPAQNIADTVATGQMKVTYLNVGQGDCTIIQTEGHNAMIDAGNNHEGKDVVDYLNQQGIDKLDYLILTHPDADHIGGGDDVLEKIEVEQVIMPDVANDTMTYEEVMDDIEKENVPQAAEQLLVNALSEKRRIVRGVVSSCIALLVVLLLALFFFYGPAVFQRGNPLPYLRAMAILNRKQQFAEVPQRSGEYISLLGEAAEAAVLTHIEAEYDAIACDQHGRAFVFQQGETRFYVMTEVYWGRFRVWVIPPPPTSEAADTEE